MARFLDETEIPSKKLVSLLLLVPSLLMLLPDIIILSLKVRTVLRDGILVDMDSVSFNILRCVS